MDLLESIKFMDEKQIPAINFSYPCWFPNSEIILNISIHPFQERERGREKKEEAIHACKLIMIEVTIKFIDLIFQRSFMALSKENFPL